MSDQNIEKHELDQGLDDLEKQAHRSLWVIGSLAFLMLFSYFVKFSGYGFSENQDEWGVLGDYVGGLLNPAISLAALYWLTRSIVLQKKELQETREALLETTFFQSQQAKSAEIAAKLQLLSIELEILSSSIETEVSYQNQILEILNSDRLIKDVYGKDGDLQSGEFALKTSQEKIKALRSSKYEILRVAKKIAPDLNASIDILKSI